jgi:hypothetical protein
LTDEVFDWFFIDKLPLPFEKKRMVRQSQIETWLDLAQVLKELGVENQMAEKQARSPARYIV